MPVAAPFRFVRKPTHESFALLQDNKPYYMELYTGRTVDDYMMAR